MRPPVRTTRRCRTLAIAAEPFEQRDELRVPSAALAKLGFGAAERALEPRAVERLQQIVDGSPGPLSRTLNVT
jgi:hypothetical protein